jgi:hypothetical protein
VGLGRTPPGARKPEAIAADWVATLPGVTIERLQMFGGPVASVGG